MNKRKFIKSLGALAVGCMMASGLSWKPERVAGKKIVVNPEYKNAIYEIQFMCHSAVVCNPDPWPMRSNNPNAIRDNDFILPCVLVDA